MPKTLQINMNIFHFANLNVYSFNKRIVNHQMYSFEIWSSFVTQINIYNVYLEFWINWYKFKLQMKWYSNYFMLCICNGKEFAHFIFLFIIYYLNQDKDIEFFHSLVSQHQSSFLCKSRPIIFLSWKNREKISSQVNV